MAAEKNNPLETPMMEQYLAFKKEAKDAILFFRLGDFYEMFFKDAVEASEILGITLTTRHKDADIPLAGIPYHSAPYYIKKLLDAGRKVAICEQMEKPDKKKKTVERKIVRVLTPGTVVEETSLEDDTSNYLLSAVCERREAGIVWVDVSCGDLYFSRMETDKALDAIKRISPKEIILHDPIEGVETAGTIDPADYEMWVPSANAAEYIGKYEQNFSHSRSLEKAFMTILYYLDRLYFGSFPPLRAPSPWNTSDSTGLDYNTVANLEIERTLIGGARQGSFLWAFDRTLTSIGKRHIKNLIKLPLRSVAAINTRLNAVECFIEHPDILDKIRSRLKNIKDIERTLSKILVKRGGPREIIYLAASLLEALEIKELLSKLPHEVSFFSDLEELKEPLKIDEPGLKKWVSLFIEEPPLNYRDGGFINPDYSPEIKELFRIITNSKELLLELEEKERTATGITTLKVGFTRVFGYYFEVTKRFADKVPPHYIRKQTTANSERFFTAGLKELEEKILNAREIMTDKELIILELAVKDVEAVEAEIQKISRIVAWADALTAFAALAKEQNYTRPVVTDGDGIEIEDGRHPVVEMMLGRGKYVPTTINIGNPDSRLSIITGPNMGGKSTVMREVALITLMAQIGSFVPARMAKIGIVDAIFTRVGASDNLAKGESTFLVEMKETAYILKNATKKSLVILDEIGRGTGTFDGISLARAIAEYLIEKNGSTVLFATHYHMLTELAEDYSCVRNFHMTVKEYKEHIQFLYQLCEGGSSRSFGVEVARLAQMPAEVVKKAEKTLRQMEKLDRQMRFEQGGSMQLDIFSLQSQAAHAQEPQENKELNELKNILAGRRPDEITPKEALDLYYSIHKLFDNINGGLQ